MRMPVSGEERLLSLEERYCHQERLIEELSGVLHGQQQAIDRLSREVSRLRAQLAEVCDQIAGTPPAEKPPHY